MRYWLGRACDDMQLGAETVAEPCPTRNTDVRAALPADATVR